MLPLSELRLDSLIYKQQPTLSRSSYSHSHVDNEGVKALVDSICHRWCAVVSGARGRPRMVCVVRVLPLVLPLPLPLVRARGACSPPPAPVPPTTDVQPLKLSLCGGTSLTHDAVSALLRLPILTELDIGGCCRIIAMDKMRLVAKVRACGGGADRGGAAGGGGLRRAGWLDGEAAVQLGSAGAVGGTALAARPSLAQH